MKSRVIALEDILHVFDAWTLIIGSDAAGSLTPGDQIDLLNGRQEKIGEAAVGRFLSSRNPAIQPVELRREVDPQDFKQVKYVRTRR
ncbi:MAG: hypothetical protein ACRED5_02965 [Propylenella sp.]